MDSRRFSPLPLIFALSFFIGTAAGNGASPQPIPASVSRAVALASLCPPGAFAIANTPNAEESVSAAFDGTNFLVGVQGDQIHHAMVTAQFVSQSGTPVGPRISTGRTGGVPYVAFDGTNYLMIWSDDATYPLSRIYGQFVSPSGALVSGPFLVAQASQNLDAGGIAFDGTDYLVIYKTGPAGLGGGSTGPLSARFVNKAGVVGSEIVLVPTMRSGYVPGIAFNGTSFLVAWRRNLATAQNVVEARTVSRTGDLGGVVTVSATISPNATLASVASDGTNFLVVWDHDIGPGGSVDTISWQTYGRVVTGAGGLLGPEFTIAGPPGQHGMPLVGYGAGSYLVTWIDMTDKSNTDTWARFVSPTGTPTGSAFAITSCPGNQGFSPAVFGLGKFLVTWIDGVDLSAGGDVYGTFVAAQGPQPCPTGAFAIANTSAPEQSTGAAFDGTNFLAGIQGSSSGASRVGGQLVSQSGNLVGALISTGRSGGSLRVAFDGTNYLMVWPDDALSSPSVRHNVVYGLLVSPAGIPVGSPFVISQGADNEEPTGLAFDGISYLVVYAIGQRGAITQLAARLVSKSGSAGPEIVVATGQFPWGSASAAFNGSKYLVAWSQYPTGSVANNPVLGSFISTAGAVSAPITVYAGAADDNGVSVASDGANFLVAWSHQPGYPSGPWEVRGRVVTPAGGFLGPDFTVAGAPANVLGPSVAFGGPNYLVTWTDQTNPSNLDVGGRFVSPSGTPTGSAFAVTSCPGNQGLSPVVFGGGKFLVTWVDGFDMGTGAAGDVYGTFVAPLQSGLSITTSSPLPSGTIGVPYSLQFAATGGTGGLTWSVVSGLLPTGMSFGATGLLSGTAAAAGTYVFTVQVSDSAGGSAQATFTLVIAGCVAPFITTQPQGATIPSGQTATLSVTASGSTPLAYEWYTGSRGDTSNPVGTNISSFTTPPLTATTSFWVRVSNACDHADSATATVTVGPAYTTFIWVPVASHVAGQFESQWRTDLGLLNPPGGTTANVEVRLYQTGGVATNTTIVPAGAQSILVDVAAQLGVSGSGAVEVRSDQPIKVTSRTYNQSANGTFGQDYTALTTDRGLRAGQSAWLPQLTENDAYRTNIGVTNTGTSPAAVTIELYDGSGLLLNSYPVALNPGEWKQESQPFRKLAGQTAMARGYARVIVTTGSGIVAYASVIDNATSDATTINLVP